MPLGEKLATVNAALNALSAIFLGMGFVAIRKRRIRSHRLCMMTVFSISLLFLISYVTRFSLTGVHRFSGEGITRDVYLLILGTHTVLAALTPFLAIVALVLALRQKFIAHRRVARVVFPIWMYVSVTGVVVYWMLYRL